MSPHFDPGLFKPALIILAAAAVVIPLFHRLRLSPVLGFMLVGVAVGPFGFATLADRLPLLGTIMLSRPESIAPIAELGICMLMFMIGLELSLGRLRVMRRLVFGLGLLQFTLSALVIGGLAWALGAPPAVAAALGPALAMSSTAVIVQVLSHEKRMAGSTGRASLAVLLFQDIAAVPVLFVISVLGADASGGAGAFAWSVGQAVLVVAGLITAGRLVLRPLFRSVARTGSPELFVAACLLVVLATGLATAEVGLPMELGSLIAGLLLAETEYRRQIEVTIEPFKGLLIGVFLISVGMSLDLGNLSADAPLLLVGGLVLVLLKLAIVVALAYGFGLRWQTGLQAGLLLGPGGEFGFVILGLATVEHLIEPAAARLPLILVAVSMACIPLLSTLGQLIARRTTARPAADPALLAAMPKDATPRVIVAGFGRVGETVASLLEAHDVPYLAVDNDPDRVAAVRQERRSVFWGDITRLELLHRLHIDTARALVVTMSDHAASDRLVAMAREARDDLMIIVRARDARHAAHLYAIGATDAVPETIEASLQLSEAVLVDLGIPMGPVIATIHEKRAEMQADIRSMAPGAAVRPLGRRRLRDMLQRSG
jgi:monovalent cation:H+ antiporter-2, CPA2 family